MAIIAIYPVAGFKNGFIILVTWKGPFTRLHKCSKSEVIVYQLVCQEVNHTVSCKCLKYCFKQYFYFAKIFVIWVFYYLFLDMPYFEHYGKLQVVTWKVIVSFFHVLCSRRKTFFLDKENVPILYYDMCLWYLFFYFS